MTDLIRAKSEAAGARLDDLMTVKAFCRRFPDLATEDQVRWWIYRREANGLKDFGAVTKKGRKWLVVLPRFKAWLFDSDA